MRPIRACAKRAIARATVCTKGIASAANSENRTPSGGCSEGIAVRSAGDHAPVAIELMGFRASKATVRTRGVASFAPPAAVTTLLRAL